MPKFSFVRKAGFAAIFALCSLLSVAAQAQDDAGQDVNAKPVPILTGATFYSTKVTGGVMQNSPWLVPVLLVPVGDKWLVEARADYYPTFTTDLNDPEEHYPATNEYNLQYATIDYIANRYVTLVAGRFLTPFGMFNERLAPYWIRPLQGAPLTNSISSNTGLGGMLRGSFPAGTQNVNLNYAFYFSSNNTHHLLATNRATGGRIGFFFPKHRFEIGTSFQQLLQGDRSHNVGLHAEWQPEKLPVTLRSEYAHSSGTRGTAYWIESAYRLSQVPYMRRLELVGRGQQVLADPKLTAAQVKQLGTLGRDTNEGDCGLNYYIGRDVRASASYGRQFALNKDANLWILALTYRFITPLAPTGGAQ
ncbi:MAG TPA: hypothetical protein VJA94_18625 [Candidatus Angelobacter sp.]